jgi:hypothetical protein
MMSERSLVRWIGKNWKGSGRSLFQDIQQHSWKGNEECHEDTNNNIPVKIQTKGTLNNPASQKCYRPSQAVCNKTGSYKV